MRVKTLLLVMVAMVCGLLATIGISQVIERQKIAAPPEETVKIFVAAADIDIGSPLNSQNIKLEEWPKDRVPDGAITKLEEVEGRYARQRLYPGEPLLGVKLMDSNSDIAMAIPEGYRACSIKVSGETVVGNLVKPGDRVDVIVFLRKGSDVPITATRTILRDVRVWAVNQKTERTVDEQGQVTTAQTVSLLVTPKQVEILTLAAELGQLRLSLRRPNDTQESDGDGTDVEAFLHDAAGGGDGATKPNALAQAPVETHQAPDGLMKLLEQMKTAPTPAVETREPIEIPQNSVQFSMTVFTPQGLVRYDWLDEKQMPQMVNLRGEAPSGAPSFAPSPLGPATKATSTPAPVPAPAPTNTSSTTGTKSTSWLDDKEGTKINVP